MCLQQAALVLNASRRFRYTLDLKKEEEKKLILRKIRAHAQAIRVQFLHWTFLVMFMLCMCSALLIHFVLIGSISFQSSWGAGAEAGTRARTIEW